MKIIKNIKLMQEYVKKQRKAGRTIGLVPTMGALHEGHLSLIRRAARENDLAVVSIFVNPTQFGPGEDFKKYPRPFAKDARQAKKSGADVIFNPAAAEMYPVGYQTYVEPGELSAGLCGVYRPVHFRGVVTVVTKLFNSVLADKAYFGQKDYQQAQIIKQMVKDLNIPIRIVICPIMREKDGLAMSSRNQYLNTDERKSAVCLYEALRVGRAMIENGIRDVSLVKKEMSGIIQSNLLAKTDYIEIVDPETLEQVKKIQGKVVIAMAVFIGKTRLIDNMVIG
jgi:pantoate--beta-alanine ligase